MRSNVVKGSLAALSVAAALVAAGAARAEAPLAEMSVEEVAAKLGQPGFHVFDANGKPVFAEGHVPGAKHVEYKKLQAKDLPADKGATLVFYCKNPG